MPFKDASSVSPPAFGGATIAQVAQVAGVAPMTVSYAFSGKRKISDKTREHVLAVARQLGYEPNPHAQRLVAGNSHDSIGLFVRHLDLGVHGEKLRALQGLLIAAGFQTPVTTGGYAHHDDATLCELMANLRRQKPRAIVCNTLELPACAFDELRRFAEMGGVVVTFDGDHDLDCDRVVFDRQSSTAGATQFLLEQGHRKIGFAHHNTISPTDLRFAGFRAALREAGLEIHTDWLFEARLPLEPERAGVQLADWFLALPASNRPTALVVVNDHTVLSLMTTLGRAGLSVPADVSVVGHDDRPFAPFLSPALSTVAHPVQEIAESVVQLLTSRLNGEAHEPRKIVLPGRLQKRDSTRPL